MIADEDEDEDNNPTVLLSGKSKYILNANSSKLARKPYYKMLQKNRFETEFCTIMDAEKSTGDRIMKLYHVFSVVKSCISENMQDGKDLFEMLKQELDAKEESIIPLRNEIMYF